MNTPETVEVRTDDLRTLERTLQSRVRSPRRYETDGRKQEGQAAQRLLDSIPPPPYTPSADQTYALGNAIRTEGHKPRPSGARGVLQSLHHQGWELTPVPPAPTQVLSRDLNVGDKIRSGNTLHTIKERKPDNSGWWLSTTTYGVQPGLADHTFDNPKTHWERIDA